MQSSGESKILEQSATRFQISNEGWTRMNAGRSASDLIREAVSNTFDADGVTEVRVSIYPGLAIIEDNSPTGIGDPNLVSTVFMTDKSDSATKRGRKGRGLKELISAARTALVDTIGYTIKFGEGRTVLANDRTLGTKITVDVPRWDGAEVEKARAYLHRIIPPPGVRFEVNDIQINTRRTRCTFNHNLKTHVVVNGVQKDTYLPTNVNVVNLAKGETEGWIYEMGIPIHPVKTKFHIDVQQRVPLNDNRDVVDSYYVSGLYGHLLSDMIDSLSLGALKQEWAQQGITHVYDNSVKEKIVRKMFGDMRKLAVKTQHKRANDVAQQAGFQVIDIKTLSSGMEELVASIVSDTETIAKRLEESQPQTFVDGGLVDPGGRVEMVVRYLGKQLLKRDLSTYFFKRTMDYTGHLRAAEFDDSRDCIGFNVNAGLPLHDPLHPNILSLVVHELAHAKTPLHNEEHAEEMQRLSGLLATLCLTQRDALLGLVSKQAEADVKKHTITCLDCGAPREVYPQDLHQVKRCVTCTKRARRQRAKLRQAS